MRVVPLLVALLLVSETSRALRMTTRSGSAPSARPRSSARWENHLALARDAYRRKHWADVRLLCSRVINVANEWDAVEQAHLRLGLAEQKDHRVEEARRVFQHGTAACPSSDTLFMAWALMESKIPDARSRKIARALLRRAVALNPARHAGVLRWRVFMDWTDAVGAAAMEATRSVLPIPTAQQQSKQGGHFEVQQGRRDQLQGGSTTGGFGLPARQHGAHLVNTYAAADSSSVSRSNKRPDGFGIYRGDRWSERQESSLATEILSHCHAIDAETGPVQSHGGLPTNADSRGQDMARTRLRSVTAELEKRGGSSGRVVSKELAGTWRLVFSTCPVSERLFTAAGGEIFERLTPPIEALEPRNCEPPVPFRCEVLTNLAARPGKPAARHYLRGWAQAPMTRTGRRVSLRQQVAPRGSGDRRVSSPPMNFLSALGRVTRGKKSLERLVVQEITYVGPQLRIGRSGDGSLFVYERCDWPDDGA